MTTHTGDILGCGEPGIMDKGGVNLSKRFGTMGAQENKFTHVGMEISQSREFAFEVPRKAFRDDLLLLPAFADL